MKKIVFDEPKTISAHDVPLESIIAVYKYGTLYGVILNHVDCYENSRDSIGRYIGTDLASSCKWFGKNCEFYLLNKKL